MFFQLIDERVMCLAEHWFVPPWVISSAGAGWLLRCAGQMGTARTLSLPDVKRKRFFIFYFSCRRWWWRYDTRLYVYDRDHLFLYRPSGLMAKMGEGETAKRGTILLLTESNWEICIPCPHTHWAKRKTHFILCLALFSYIIFVDLPEA